jgi:hypothetical protein
VVEAWKALPAQKEMMTEWEYDVYGTEGQEGKTKGAEEGQGTRTGRGIQYWGAVDEVLREVGSKPAPSKGEGCGTRNSFHSLICWPPAILV